MSRFADAADGIDNELRCSFGEYLAGLEEEERADICTLMESKGNQYVIRLIFQLDGKRFSKSTLSAHTRRGCRCHGS